MSIEQKLTQMTKQAASLRQFTKSAKRPPPILFGARSLQQKSDDLDRRLADATAVSRKKEKLRLQQGAIDEAPGHRQGPAAGTMSPNRTKQREAANARRRTSEINSMPKEFPSSKFDTFPGFKTIPQEREKGGAWYDYLPGIKNISTGFDYGSQLSRNRALDAKAARTPGTQQFKAKAKLPVDNSLTGQATRGMEQRRQAGLVRSGK